MPRATPDGMKVCSKCRENKPVGEFHKCKRLTDGLRSTCRVCCGLASKAYNEANQDKVRAVSAAWKAANPDKVKAAYVAWAAANPDKVKAKNAAWKVANPDKFRAIGKRYAARLPDFMVKKYLNLKDAPPELIELKRLQVQIKRELKRQEQSK